LKISSGKTVALVGASGCGSESRLLDRRCLTLLLVKIESTTIQLIQRFYDPDVGRILIDGKDVRTLNISWLRSHIGLVSQEPVLFAGSIEENIRFGKPSATLEEVQQAARMANAHDFIMALPEVIFVALPCLVNKSLLV
jgi:ABC-type multidrug transport system fused ATPase/permease subunit